MIHLTEIDETNYAEALRLSVTDGQQRFLADAAGILARGYAYRRCNGRVFGIANGDQLVGLALVRDLNEEPACYELQQFFIDRRFQNRSYGSQALRLILALLREEGRYADVEVCVDRANAAALRLFENHGFTDTGYIDPDLPESRNLMHHFSSAFTQENL